MFGSVRLFVCLFVRSITNKKDGYRQLNVRQLCSLRPGTIAVNVTWIEREFNAGQTPRSMYPSIFNRFPVGLIQAVKSKVRNFSTFWPPLGTPL